MPDTPYLEIGNLGKTAPQKSMFAHDIRVVDVVLVGTTETCWKSRHVLLVYLHQESAPGVE